MAGNWSEPEVIQVDDVPPPSQIVPQLLELTPVVDSQGGVSFRLVMRVEWESSAEETRRRRRRQAVSAPTEVTQYTVVVGEQELEPYDPIPISSAQRHVDVRSFDYCLAGMLSFSCHF